MNFIDYTLADAHRARHVPIRVYTPKNTAGALPVIIFNPNYQEQRELKNSTTKLGCKNFEYLAKFFTGKGYAFISIQHDILGDNDGIEKLDTSIPKAIARQHLWVRGEQNIIFVISELKKKFPNFSLNKFIIAGHSMAEILLNISLIITKSTSHTLFLLMEEGVLSNHLNGLRF